MKPFKDAAGRTWTLAITVGAAKRVKGLLGHDLLQPQSGDPALYLALHRDPILLADVIYCILKPDADKAGVTDEQFGEALNGEIMGLAYKAFMEDWADFFHGLQRLDLEALLKAQMNLVMEQVERGVKAVERQTVAIKAAMQETDLGVGMISGNSLA